MRYVFKMKYANGMTYNRGVNANNHIEAWRLFTEHEMRGWETGTDDAELQSLDLIEIWKGKRLEKRFGEEA